MLSQDTDIPLSLVNKICFLKVLSWKQINKQHINNISLFILQIFLIAAHLVYWGKARIIYPLCESNVYVVSPTASIHS
jgi:hypothetical protein